MYRSRSHDLLRKDSVNYFESIWKLQVQGSVVGLKELVGD